MTFDEARASRRTYLTVSASAFIFGTLTLFVTVLKGLYLIAYQQGGLGSDAIKAVVSWIYEHGIVISSLWPWMSDTGFGGTFNFPLSPSAILGLVLLIISATSLKNSARLKRWMSDVKELLAKEEMAASRRPPSQRQSVGNIASGGDTHVTQQITNHYNHRPDNPRTLIIVAVIGAIATVIASLLKSGH